MAFHFCPGCGGLAYATLEDASSGRVVAVMRVALFESIRAAAPPVQVSNFEGETVEAARARRLAGTLDAPRGWTPLQRS